MGLMLSDIIGERFKVHHLDFHEKGDHKGYITGMIEFANRDKAHELLFRVHDPKNGDSNKLVSIDYGYKNPLVDELWQAIENEIKQAYKKLLLSGNEASMMYSVKAKLNGEEHMLGYANWNDCIKLFNETKNNESITYTDIGIYDESGELLWN